MDVASQYLTASEYTNLNAIDSNSTVANQNIHNLKELMKLNMRIQAGHELSEEDNDYYEQLILGLNMAMHELKK